MTNSTAHEIYLLAQASSFVTTKHAAESAGVSVTHANKLLLRMCDEGLLTRKWRDRRWHYLVPESRCPHCGQVIR